MLSLWFIKEKIKIPGRLFFFVVVVFCLLAFTSIWLSDHFILNTPDNLYNLILIQANASILNDIQHWFRIGILLKDQLQSKRLLKYSMLNQSEEAESSSLVLVVFSDSSLWLTPSTTTDQFGQYEFVWILTFFFCNNNKTHPSLLQNTWLPRPDLRYKCVFPTQRGHNEEENSHFRCIAHHSATQCYYSARN